MVVWHWRSWIAGVCVAGLVTMTARAQDQDQAATNSADEPAAISESADRADGTDAPADAAEASTPTEPALLDTIPVAQRSSEPVPDVPAEEGPAQLETIEVTASYRSQNIQDVVGGAHAFDGRELDRTGATGMEDYLNQVPSVSLQKSGAGTNKIAMRGISNVNESDLGYADGSSTTGVYLNDVAIQGSGVFPDLSIYDLSRIEVLKGPQGTLYGEGSMGGAVKMVTRAPQPNLWELRGNVSGAMTEEGDNSYDGRLAVNVPLGTDSLAARLVGTVRNTGGFVDYTALDRPDADRERAHSLRGIGIWQATEALEFELMYLTDYTNREQFPVVDEGSEEELTNSRSEDQYAITDFSIGALTARWELSFATLTSVTGIYDTFRDMRRRTPVLQNLLQTAYQQTGLGQAPDIFTNGSTTVVTDLDSFSQELRLVSFGDTTWSWIGGLFYRDRNQTFDQEKREDTIPEVDPTGGVVSGLLGGFYPAQGRQEKGNGDEVFTQYAAYGEVTWQVIPGTLDLTGGLRYFTEDVSFFIDTRFYGFEAFLFATDPGTLEPGTNTAHVYFEEEVSTDGLLPKVSAAWHLDIDHMLYGTVSRGFRSGTANVYAALESGPPVVRPDYVWNKELGLKSTWLDGSLITNLSVYHLDWEDMQGTVLGTARLGAAEIDFAHLDNAGDAVVLGAEASIAWLPVRDLTLQLSGGYNDGEVTKPREGSQVRKGSKLPNMPPLTWNATASYDYALPWALSGQASATYSFIDKQGLVFEPEPQYDAQGNEIPVASQYQIPSYDVLKAQVGLQRGSWQLQLFGDNLLDRRAIVAVSGPIAQYTVITPRTVGVRLGYDF